MVIVKITGGLGNQLFQYAFGQYLSKLLKTDVKYDLQTNISMNNFSSRSFALLDFNFQVEVAKKEDVQRMKLFSNGLCSRFERKLTQKVSDLNQEMSESERLLREKNVLINELREKVNNPYNFPSQTEKFQEGFDIKTKIDRIPVINRKSFKEKVIDLIETFF